MGEAAVFHALIEKQRTELLRRIEARRLEMEEDDTGHYLLFEALGIRQDECSEIDLFQNVGRFVYRRAGTLLESLAVTAMQLAKGGEPIVVPNNISQNPRTFRIDWYVDEDNKAHEIKWRDATTDGDHIRKERDKVLSIVKHGMIPVRVMFYYPQRTQAQAIQQRVLAFFSQHGEAYVEDGAWAYIKEYTGYDLLSIVREEAENQQTLTPGA